MATLPLGTGNDLARMLGWGSGYENEDLETVIQDVHHAPVALLDRSVLNNVLCTVQQSLYG